jgi:hypothetical protein
MNNEARIERAAAAIGTYDEYGEELIDLLADLLHWAERNGHDFDDALRIARGHYEAERAENGEGR